MSVRDAIHGRVSVEEFDREHELDEDTIVELVADAVQAPSSFNIQHWRFVAVRRREDKERLAAAAFGQRQVADAAVTFIVLGDLRGHEALDEIMELAVERGTLEPGKAAAWIRMAGEIYADETLARDEAIRSASLAAMSMMLSAHERGMATGALSGFDPDRVRDLFRISDRYLPVMLLAVGEPTGERPSRQPRLPVERILAFDDGASL